jgi:hypothetical protein
MRVGKDLHGVVLEPAILGSDLLMLDDLFVDESAIGFEDGEFSRGGRLVYRCNILTEECPVDEM